MAKIANFLKNLHLKKIKIKYKTYFYYLMFKVLRWAPFQKSKVTVPMEFEQVKQIGVIVENLVIFLFLDLCWAPLHQTKVTAEFE